MTTTERVETAEAVVKDLKGRIRGPLLRPGDPGFDEARSVWNAMIDRRPALIVRCLGTADVIAGVNAAREHGLPLSIKGGGHNIAGLAVCEGGLMLDMSLMRGVWVDPPARIARAQAGCLLGDVDAETQVHGLAAVLGFVSATGCAGLTLGGGFGYLSRRFGWTTDNLVSVDLVTAAGRPVRASAHENSDLFWGLCGGGGNFGVATSFEYGLHPVGPRDRRRRDRVARRRGGRRARDVSSGRGERAPRADLRRRPAPGAAGAVDRQGRARQADRRALRLLLRIARRRGTGAGADQGVRQPGRRHRAAAVVRLAADAARRDPAEGTALLLEVRVSADDRPSGHRPGDRARGAHRLAAFRDPDLPARRRRQRAARGSLGGRQPRRRRRPQHLGRLGPRRQTTPQNIEWARETWRDMRQFSTGGTYINFLTEDEGDDRTRAAYRTNYQRLARVKAEWDPGNLFRTNKNISRA